MSNLKVPHRNVEYLHYLCCLLFIKIPVVVLLQSQYVLLRVTEILLFWFRNDMVLNSTLFYRCRNNPV